jgi:hypothetical protein
MMVADSENNLFPAPSTAYSLPIYCLFTAYSLPIHCLFTVYALSMHCLCTVYSLPIHCLFTPSTEERSACQEQFNLLLRKLGGVARWFDVMIIVRTSTPFILVLHFVRRTLLRFTPKSPWGLHCLRPRRKFNQNWSKTAECG